MAARKTPDAISNVVKEVEGLARALRVELRKREATVEKSLRKAADELRKRAIDVAGQVEKYAHQLKQQLEGAQAAPTVRRKKGGTPGKG